MERPAAGDGDRRREEASGSGRLDVGGPPPEEAAVAVLLLHGRGGTAESMLSLAEALDVGDIAYLAPEAPGLTWYPESFLAPLEQNEPALSSSLGRVGELVADLEGRGLGSERIVLLGFSQGGCLGLEYAARNARRYGALVGLSSGLIGPRGTPRDYDGTFDGTPAFLGCSDVDPHIPPERLDETAEVLGWMGAAVEKRVYPSMGHLVNRDELLYVRDLLTGLAAG